MPSIHQISRGSPLKSCCNSIRARAVRSIKTRFLTLPPSAGYTINIFCGGTDPFMIDPFLFAPYWYPVPVYYFPVGWRRHREPTRFVGFGGGMSGLGGGRMRGGRR